MKHKTHTQLKTTKLKKTGKKTVFIRGETGIRRLPGFGRILHYPAIPGPAGYYFKNMAESGEYVTIFTTLNYMSRSETQNGHLVLRLSLMHHTASSRVTDNCGLGASQGRAASE